ncbi:MAG: glucose-6-phosphate dehydrogenase assembly protein OpcA [Deltaproteobacteria bacterium]|nr:glucose-6-phosphate dehydrogenase assembly protein OpcA [Deltaproteobacteria bacterium]
MTAVSIAPSSSEVTAENAERALDRAWMALGDPPRARTLNLVCVCQSDDEVQFAIEATREVIPGHPGRVIVVRLGSPIGDSPVIVRASLLDDASNPGTFVGESLILSVTGTARDHVATVVERLLAPGVPLVLWWLGDVPDDPSSFVRLADRSDVLCVDSSQIDLSDLVTLQRFVAQRARVTQSISDLEWLRLRAWQESLARFFDDPASLAGLGRCDALEVAFNTPARGDFASAKAALFAGWFATRLKLRTPSSVRWATRENGRALWLTREDGQPFSLTMTHDLRPNLHPGALTRVTVSSSVGDRFEIERELDPRVLAWRGYCAGAIIPECVLRIGSPDTPRMLRRLLDRPERDELFLEALTISAPWVLGARAL